MWFLDATIALRLLAAGVLWAAVSRIACAKRAQRRSAKALLLLDIALIAWVDALLCAFYIGYTVLTWLLSLFVRRVRGDVETHAAVRARALFVLACFLCAGPFFYLRLSDVTPALPKLLTLVGFAYQMLKAIDGVYYTYYTGERLDLLNYAGFLLFFPTFTAGPILRYRDFLRDVERPKPVTGERFTAGVKRVIRGYFKKVVLLSLVSILLSRTAEAPPHLWLSLLTCLVSYALLWFDMSGYADIAIGLGAMMGFTVAENFKHPLRAASFTQFWRNWHVSLTDWIREHIFVVLNNKPINKYQGALIGFGTMMVMNFWHGMSALFLADGLLTGTILAVENLTGLSTVNKRQVKKSYYVFRCALVTLIFGFDTIFYTLSSAQLSNVLHGFLRL